jgi:hypothetical protein
MSISGSTNNFPSKRYNIISMDNGRINILNDENNARFSITDSNFIFLMRHSAVKNLFFEKECVMVKEDSKTLLIPINSEEYQALLQRPSKKIRLTMGGVYRLSGNKIEEQDYVYLGRYTYYSAYVEKEEKKLVITDYPLRNPEYMVFKDYNNELKFIRSKNYIIISEKTGFEREFRNKNENISFINDLIFDTIKERLKKTGEEKVFATICVSDSFKSLKSLKKDHNLKYKIY